MIRLAPLIAEHVSPSRAAVDDDVLAELLNERDCGTGAGGFQPGNKCAAGNKGSGESRPAVPSPKGVKDPSDIRGQQSGHSAEQRRAHAFAVAEYCESLGVTYMPMQPNELPPTMDSIEAVASGVESVVALGLPLPETISTDSLPGDAPMGYLLSTGEFLVSPDYSQKAIDKYARDFILSAPPDGTKQAGFLHETAHRVHVDALIEEYGNRDAAIDQMQGWRLIPNAYGLYDSPWSYDKRITRTAESSDGRPLSYSEAKAVASRVGEYASQDPAEFVAEVFTAVSLGRTYDDEVMRLYDDYLGPPIPRREQPGRRSRIVDTSRAFCPRVSPPDNSCAPANKGKRAPKPPSTSEPYSREKARKYFRAAEKWLSENGVKVDIGRLAGEPPTTAISAVIDGVKAMKSAGLTPPEEVLVDVPFLLSSAGEYDPVEDTILVSIYINPDQQKSNAENGWTVGDPKSPMASTLVHEDAHRQHIRGFGANAEEMVDKLTGDYDLNRLREKAEREGRIFRFSAGQGESLAWNPEYRGGAKEVTAVQARDIASQVSRYAQKDPLEFVAEVRTGIVFGRRYSDEVMELYEAYGGPPVGKGRRRR